MILPRFMIGDFGADDAITIKTVPPSRARDARPCAGRRGGWAAAWAGAFARGPARARTGHARNVPIRHGVAGMPAPMLGSHGLGRRQGPYDLRRHGSLHPLQIHG